MNQLIELQERSIVIDEWAVNQVGLGNSGPYKKEYPKIAVEDNGEPLVSVSAYGVVSSDYYLGEFLSGKNYLEDAFSKGYLRPFALLRRSHVTRLIKADKFLRNLGLFLHVQSGWRHPYLQDLVRKEYAKEHGLDQANRMFAATPEGINAAPPPHATGAAFDVELRSLDDGARQELYCDINGRQIYGSIELENIVAANPELGNDPMVQQAVSNRRILFHCLCRLGVVFDDERDLFTPHPGECWHFGDGDPLSAYLKREPVACYGLAVPE